MNKNSRQSTGLPSYKLSVFDLDHTLLNTNCSFRFGFFLYNKRFFRLNRLIQCLTYYARHKWFGMPVEDLHHKSFDVLFKGKSRQVVDSYAEEFLDKELEDMTNQPIFFLLQQALQRGDHCVIFSGSPDFLVGPIANKWGVSPHEATQYQRDSQGNFINISRVMEGMEKAIALTALVKVLGIDLSSVTVYSDSILDLPLLNMAGKAIAVFPDRSLRRVCEINDWQILD